MNVLRSLSAFVDQPLLEEVMVGLGGARVLYANHDLIRQHAGIEDAEEIDQWLLRETAFISRPQASQCVVNTPIVTTNRERLSFRPPRYCRAAVLETKPSPSRRLLLDVKGCGIEPADVPVLPNSNGLLTISEAIHEMVFERLTRAVLAHCGSNATTIPVYALIDLGFHARFHGVRPDERAVLLVRCAQTRPEFQWGRSDPGPEAARELLEIELSLRRYGISASSCGAVRFVVQRDGVPAVMRDGRILPFDQARIAEICERVALRDDPVIIDGVNVQVASSRTEILDFGRYRFRSSFENVLYAAWDRDYETLRGDFVLPSEDRYPQPDPRLSLASLVQEETWKALHDAIGSIEIPDRVVLNDRFEELLAVAFQRLR